jgi:NAD(P)H dehydrogenase (quinone)
MIIVTGATGQLGQAIVERLLEKQPNLKIGVSVREPEKAQSLTERGVRVRQADYADAASLRHAFEGAEQVLIVSSNTTGGIALQHHRNAIGAAQAVGARRVLYTSHMGANPHSLFAPMPDHAATEEVLQASGIAFTSLRNGFYAESGLMLMGEAFKTGEVVAPEDGPVSWTTHADLADAAVIALTAEQSWGGITAPLTGSQALNLADLATLASELSGRTIKRVTVSDEKFRAGLVSHGLPAGRVDMIMGLYAASRNGEFSAVDPTLEQTLGRAPISMRDFLTQHLAA